MQNQVELDKKMEQEMELGVMCWFMGFRFKGYGVKGSTPIISSRAKRGEAIPASKHT